MICLSVGLPLVMLPDSVASSSLHCPSVPRCHINHVFASPELLKIIKGWQRLLHLNQSLEPTSGTPLLPFPLNKQSNQAMYQPHTNSYFQEAYVTAPPPNPRMQGTTLQCGSSEQVNSIDLYFLRLSKMHYQEELFMVALSLFPLH